MVVDLVLRFLIGGLVVAAFAVIADVLTPKTFAGLFCAAPSVAIATVGLTLATKGPHVASVEGRSMMVGAAALAVYSLCAQRLMRNENQSALLSSSASMVGWFVVAFGVWALVLQ